METIRITKAQKFDVAIAAIDALRHFQPDFSMDFSGTDTKSGVTVSLNDLEEFFNSEKSLLARKNSSTNNPDKMSDTQKENQNFKDEIKKYLATLPVGDDAPSGYSATDIFLHTSISEKGYQLPKVTALLSQLSTGTKTRPGTGEVERVKGPKGQTLFRLA